MLPLLALASVLLSSLRIANGLDFAAYYLSFIVLLDLLLILLFNNKLITKYTVACFVLLVPAFIIGFFNNEISRRYLTDFMLPFIFFLKIAVFSEYWKTQSMEKYIIKFSRITFAVSLILIFVVYFIFMYFDASRISILAPLEVPAALYLLTNPILFLMTLILIVLYGKRAQLVSVVIVFLISFKIVSPKIKLAFLLMVPILLFSLFTFIVNEPDNISVMRMVYSFELLMNGDFGLLSAGRLGEVNAILKDMEWSDYIFGKGNGYVYERPSSQGGFTVVSNAHFTPVGLISKYGVFFTVFVYYFFFKLFISLNLKESGVYHKAIYISVLVIFIESFFSYALFVLPILPVLLGALKAKSAIR